MVRQRCECVFSRETSTSPGRPAFRCSLNRRAGERDGGKRRGESESIASSALCTRRVFSSNVIEKRSTGSEETKTIAGRARGLICSPSAGRVLVHALYTCALAVFIFGSRVTFFVRHARGR